MRYNINIITELLKFESNHYRDAYDAAIQNRKKAVEKLNANYLQGTPLYKQKEAAIETEFNDRISQLRSEALDRTMPDLAELKEQEIRRVKKVQTAGLLQLQNISQIPMTTAEVETLVSEFSAKDDYWSSRMLSQICEQNGISPATVGLEPPIDTKLSVLGQLEEQMNKIVQYYGAGGIYTDESKRSKNLYLNDRILEHAQKIYNGTSSTLSPSEAASKAYLTIRAQLTETSKGIVAGNALRNAAPELRNYLLYDLSQDESFSDTAASIAGISSEIRDFKNGKADEFEAAVAAMQTIRKSADKSEVADVLAQNRENGFLTQMYGEEIKRNGLLADIVAAPASDS